MGCGGGSEGLAAVANEKVGFGIFVLAGGVGEKENVGLTDSLGGLLDSAGEASGEAEEGILKEKAGFDASVLAVLARVEDVSKENAAGAEPFEKGELVDAAGGSET